MAEIKKIQTFGLNKDGMYSALEDVALQTITLFNEQYDEEYEPDDDLKNYLLLLATINLYGWEGIKINEFSDFSLDTLKESIPDYTNYKGIDTTTKKIIDGIDTTTKKIIDGKFKDTEPTDEQIQEIVENRTQTIIDGLLANTIQVTNFRAAEATGWDNYIGGLTVLDDRVRPKHQKHERRYWRNDGTYQPWFDYGCRCSYVFFKTEQDAIDAGFLLFD